jgi:hypothetical protein
MQVVHDHALRIAVRDCGDPRARIVCIRKIMEIRMPALLTSNGLKEESGENVEASTLQTVSYNLNHYKLIWNEREV